MIEKSELPEHLISSPEKAIEGPKAENTELQVRYPRRNALTLLDTGSQILSLSCAGLGQLPTGTNVLQSMTDYVPVKLCCWPEAALSKCSMGNLTARLIHSTCWSPTLRSSSPVQQAALPLQSRCGVPSHPRVKDVRTYVCLYCSLRPMLFMYTGCCCVCQPDFQEGMCCVEAY